MNENEQNNEPLNKDFKEPKIRFKQFNLPYKSGLLSDVAIQIKRKSDGNNYPIMMISSTEGFINQAERYSKDNAGTSKAKYTLLYYGELSYNHGNSKTKKYGSVFTLNKQAALIPFVYHSFKTQNQNPFYFGIYLNLSMHDKYLVKVISSGARMDGLLNISFEDFFKMPIKYPNVDEQDYIECFLKHIDEKILIVQNKTNALKKYKEGLIQEGLELLRSTLDEYVHFSDLYKKYKTRNECNLAQFTVGKDGLKLLTETNYDLSNHIAFEPFSLLIGIGIEEISVSENETGSVSPVYNVYNIKNLKDFAYTKYFLKPLLWRKKAFITRKSTRREYEGDINLLENIKLPISHCKKSVSICEAIRKIEQKNIYLWYEV